jgi:hypothetical protein
MASRLELHEVLCGILENRNAYFQPPASLKLKYPCIVYARDHHDIKYANDNPYTHAKRYKVTIIDYDPDSPIPDKVAMLPTCKFVTSYKDDNLNHDVYELYF